MGSIMYWLGDTLYHGYGEDRKAVQDELDAHYAEKTRASRAEALALVADVKNARAEAEREQASLAVVKSQAGFRPGPSPGVDAVPFEGGRGSFSGTAAEEVNRRVGELVAAGKSRGAALSTVFRDDPGLHRSYIEEHGRQ